MHSHAFMPTSGDDAVGLLDRLFKAQRSEDAEHYELVRSILESPDGTDSSVGWFVFVAQAKLHEG